MPLLDYINRVLRDFERYTGDGKPGAPSGAPLPTGDPSSGRRNIPLHELRGLLKTIAQAVGDPEALDAIVAQLAAKADQSRLDEEQATRSAADTKERSDRIAADSDIISRFRRHVKLFGSRTEALSLIPTTTRQGDDFALVAEGASLVLRWRHAESDDPLYPVVPRWGVVARYGQQWTAAEVAVAQQILQAMEDARDATEGYAASATGTPQYSSRASAQAANIPTTSASILVSGVPMERVSSGGAIQSADGAHWQPAAAGYIELFGDPGLAETWSQASAWSGRTGRPLKGLSDRYTVIGTITPANEASFDFDQMTVIYRGLPGAPLLKTVGFDDYADGVRRSYTWRPTLADRNAGGHAAGQHVMVAPTPTDWNGAVWYRATATPANSDAAWVEAAPVVGQVGGAYRNVRFDGGESGGSSDLVVGVYGIDISLDTFRAEGGGIALHTESPGSVYSTQVGRNLQWSVSDIECRNYSHTGWIANHQSDGTVYGAISFAPDDTIATLLHIRSKCTGTKWLGGHTWGGFLGSKVVIDAGTNTMFGFEHERPVEINKGGFQFHGQVYRINDASRENGPAFIMPDGTNGCRIVGRVNHFRYPVKMGVGCVGNVIDITYYSQDPGAAPFSPDSSLNPNNNRWNLSKTGTGMNARSEDDRRKERHRRKRQFIAYSATITPDLSAGDVIEVAPLEGNISISAPLHGEEGDYAEFMFMQDAAGGRTIAWGEDYVGGPTAGGASYTRRAVRFVSDGVRWIACGDTGAWV